jgi:hypothetical protein
MPLQGIRRVSQLHWDWVSDEHKGEDAGRAQTYLQHGWEGRKGGLHGNLLQSPARTEENEGGDGSRTEGALS